MVTASLTEMCFDSLFCTSYCFSAPTVYSLVAARNPVVWSTTFSAFEYKHFSPLSLLNSHFSRDSCYLQVSDPADPLTASARIGSCVIREPCLFALIPQILQATLYKSLHFTSPFRYNTSHISTGLEPFAGLSVREYSNRLGVISVVSLRELPCNETSLVNRFVPTTVNYLFKIPFALGFFSAWRKISYLTELMFVQSFHLLLCCWSPQVAIC